MRSVLTVSLAVVMAAAAVMPVRAQSPEFPVMPVFTGSPAQARPPLRPFFPPPARRRAPLRLRPAVPAPAPWVQPRIIQPSSHKGAIMGAVIGIGVGALVGYAAPSSPGQTRSEHACWGALGIGIMGGYFGHAFDF